MFLPISLRIHHQSLRARLGCKVNCHICEIPSGRIKQKRMLHTCAHMHTRLHTHTRKCPSCFGGEMYFSHSKWPSLSKEVQNASGRGEETLLTISHSHSEGPGSLMEPRGRTAQQTNAARCLRHWLGLQPQTPGASTVWPRPRRSSAPRSPTAATPLQNKSLGSCGNPGLFGGTQRSGIKIIP